MTLKSRKPQPPPCLEEPGSPSKPSEKTVSIDEVKSPRAEAAGYCGGGAHYSFGLRILRLMYKILHYP